MARVGRKRTRIARKRCVREVRINVHHLFFKIETRKREWHRKLEDYHRQKNKAGGDLKKKNWLIISGRM